VSSQYNLIPLDAEIIKAINEFIADKFNEELRKEFPNRILREDVLDLLGKYCHVVYYPLDNEDNNGFHMTGITCKTGEELHIVYINTAQTIEKQVITAAHELGHVWNVDNYIEEKCGKSLTDDVKEHIINRFAAELLIPKQEFLDSYNSKLNKYRKPEGKITVLNMLRVIAALMNQFFVPLKSIVYRCQELGRFSEKTVRLLLGQDKISQSKIDKAMQIIFQENGYLEFQKPTQKKWIDGLAELLERAEQSKTLSETKIKNLREKFDLPEETIKNKEMDETI